jgi:uncharacterized protein (TIGR03437 family)
MMTRRVAVPRVMRQFATLMALSATFAFGFAANPASLVVSNTTAPSGGWAQIQIFAAKPGSISSGHLVLNLDATFFGPGAMVGLFGASGDALGAATTNGSQVDVQFSSATGGIGQMAGLPVMVISVPVLAPASGVATVSATSPDSSVVVASGTFTVQGKLSVQKIYAGMGVMAAGTVVTVYGSGFTPSTTVAIDGVAIASAKFVSAGEIDVTLGGAAELVGKRARVTDGGAEFDYFCFQPNDPINSPLDPSYDSTVSKVQPLFPLVAFTGAGNYFAYLGGVVAMQNPNSTPATANWADVDLDAIGYQPETQGMMTIPPGSWAFLPGDSTTSFQMTSDLPLRVVVMSNCFSIQVPFCPSAAGAFDYAAPGGTAPQLAPSSLLFGWQLGAAVLPAAQTVSVSPIFFLKAAAVASGASWLSASFSTTHNTVTASVNPSQLSPGTYQGSIAVKGVSGPFTSLPVILTITNAPPPSISAAPQNLSFTAPAFNAVPYTQTIAVTSDSGPTPFIVTPVAGGGNIASPFAWLTVSPLSGTTPATLTVTWDPTVTSQIPANQRATNASILINGAGNTLTIPATFNVTGVQTFQTSQGEAGQGPNGLVFSAQTGTGPQTQILQADPMGSMTATVDQAWMTAVPVTSGQGANQNVSVTVDPSGLTPGVYNGSVTIGEAGLVPIAVPVTLGVWSKPPVLTIMPGSFTFVHQAGENTAPLQTAEIDSSGIPVPFGFASGASWLNVSTLFKLTPAPVQIGAINGGPPGEYDGSFTVTGPGGSVSAPVTLLVLPGPVTPPVVSQVANAASGIAGSVSPGEILEIRGYGVGASLIGGLMLNASGLVSSNVNGLQVTFDGKAAPLIYTSAGQTNLIVPYEIAGKTSTVMQITYASPVGALQTTAWTLPVAAAAPGVFTIDATGTGQGSIVNQDGTVNSVANPAARGSVISIYATGEGQTSPAGVTGSVTQADLKTPLLPVTVTMGGINATVQYAGSASDAVAGLLQVNVVVPQGVSPAAAVPVVVGVGGVASQPGVTLAVK